MNEMIERVALAIYEEGLVRARTKDYTHEALLAVARVGLAAMREPTAAMIDAGWDSAIATSGEGTLPLPERIERVWQAMIDAALAELDEAAITPTPGTEG